MINLAIMCMVSIILLYFNVTKTRKKTTLINIIIIAAQILGIIGAALYYALESKIGNEMLIFTSIFTIIIPLIVVLIEYGSKLLITEVIILLGQKIFCNLGNRRKAKEIILSYLEKNPKSYILHKKLGEIYEQEGGIRKAVKQYVEAVYINKKDYNTFFKIITLMQDLEKTEEAIELLRRLIKVRPDYAKAQILLTEMLLDSGEIREASKVINEAVKENEEDFDIVYLASNIHILLNEYSKTKEYLEKALKINPISSGVLINLGQLELIEGEYKKAKKYFENASEYRKVADIALYELAKIDVLEENPNEAIEKINKLLDINPEMINKINENVLFEEIKDQIIVKLELVKKEKVKLERKVVENINNLESVLELSLMLKYNEKQNKLTRAIDTIIREQEENKTLEEKEYVFNKQKQFIEENIEKAEEDI